MEEEIEIEYLKTPYQNADTYFLKAKRIKKKIKGLILEIKKGEETKETKETKDKEKEKKEIKNIKKRWFEQFAWSKTKKGKLILIGKSAQQNERLLKKYLEENDLLFHAQVYGGGMVVLKDGLFADEEEKKEAAQLAATFSSAWQQATEDVFMVKKEQIKKDNLKKGQINIEGKREWYYSMPIGLYFYYDKEDKRYKISSLFNPPEGRRMKIKPGKTKRKKTTKEIIRRFKVKTSDFSLLPGKEHALEMEGGGFQ